MKLYAVVIGGPRPYVALHPDHQEPLAVFETHFAARFARNEILETCGHKDVHIKTFEDE